MEESNKGRSSEEEKQAQPVHRRKLLKIMATTTGAAGLSFLLPAKWTKPLTDVIVLPAHAQTSVDDPPVINNFSVYLTPAFGGMPDPANKSNARHSDTLVAPVPTPTPTPIPTCGTTHYGSIDIADPFCEANDGNTSLFYEVGSNGEIGFTNCTTASGQLISAIGGSLTLNATTCNGTVEFYFNGTQQCGNSLAVHLGVNGRLSNVVNQSIPCQANSSG